MTLSPKAKAIGLLGGSNVFQYAPNPIGWIDPWGLASELCVFGNKTQPKGIRDRDLMPDENGILPSQADVLNPKGKSATRTPETSGLTGHYHKIVSETEMPEGLGIKHDGRDMPGGYMSPGHSTIYPTRNMTQAEFDQKLLSLPWSYGGKIE